MKIQKILFRLTRYHHIYRLHLRPMTIRIRRIQVGTALLLRSQ
jgi:hypothetical protein